MIIAIVGLIVVSVITVLYYFDDDDVIPEKTHPASQNNPADQS